MSPQPAERTKTFSAPNARTSAEYAGGAYSKYAGIKPNGFSAWWSLLYRRTRSRQVLAPPTESSGLAKRLSSRPGARDGSATKTTGLPSAVRKWPALGTLVDAH